MILYGVTKGGLISEFFTLVPISQKMCQKLSWQSSLEVDRNSGLAHFWEIGAKVKNFSEIKLPLKLA